MIPKVIHYCWFGRGEKPQLVQDCMESWKKYCPDYEIKEWNEDNWDVNLCQYTKEAYEQKKWAFVSDVARLDIIYREGGIYLDTDVELLRPLDELLDYNLYFGFENPNGFNTGNGFGGVKSHPVLRTLLSDYYDRPLLYPGQKRLDVCTKIQTKSLRKIFPDLIMDGSLQIFDGTVFLPEEYLNPYVMKTEKSISYHHNSLSWMDAEKRNMSDNAINNSVFKKSNIVRKIRNPKITLWLEKHLGTKIAYAYVFVTYDLIDYGLWYFVKKAFLKLRKK